MSVLPEELVPQPGSGHAFFSGVVVDEGGKPVPGATVEVWSHPRGDVPAVPVVHASATAGADGRFRVGPGPSPWSRSGILTAIAPGFARACLISRQAADPAEDAANEGREARVVLRRGHRVSGDARNQVGGPPDAPVTIWASGQRNFSEPLTSDAAGAFSFLAPEGIVTLRVMGGAHPPAGVRFEVKGEAEVRTSVVLRSGRDIRGRVVDRATGGPVPGAVLSANYGRRRILRADAEGKFLLPRFWNNAFQVVAPGYASVRHRVSSDAGTAFAGEETVRLPPGFVARGKVTDLDGRPLAGLRLHTFDQEADGTWIDMVGPASRKDGSFTIAGLPVPSPGEGRSRVFASTAGFGYGASGPLRGWAGEVVEGVEIRVPRLVAVEGRVEDEYGKPAAAAVSVSWRLAEDLEPFAGQVPGMVPLRAGSDGRWSLEVPERSEIHAVATGDAFLTGAADGVSPAHADSLPDRSRLAAAPLVLKVRRGISIRGTVADARGNPVTGGDIRIEPSPPTDPRPPRDATVRPDGTFESGGLEPGLYDVSVVVHPEFLQEVVRGIRRGGEPVRVVLRRSGSVQGRIPVPEGASPKLRAVVRLRALGETRPLPPLVAGEVNLGDSTFTLRPLAPGPYALSVSAGDWRLDRERVEVLEREPTDLGSLALERGAAVAGKVIVGARPTAGAPVELLRTLPDGRAESVRREVTGNDGAYRIGGLKAGVYLLSVRVPGRPALDLPVEVGPGGETRADAAVPLGGVLVVKVVDGTGAPAPGVRVLLAGEKGGLLFWKEGSADPGPHETGEGGVLRCAGVAAGRLRVTADRPGVGSGEAEATVEEGRVATVEVRIAAR